MFLLLNTTGVFPYLNPDPLLRYNPILQEIIRSNITAVTLQLKAIGIVDVQSFDFLDKPDSKLINDALDFLKSVEAISLDDVMTMSRI